jgi:SAM-dependent methyltransferase
MYQDLAVLYDRIFPLNPKVIEFLEALMPNAPSRILDVGCGTGKYAGHLSAVHEVFGIDPDGGSIALAKANHRSAHFMETDLFDFEALRQFDLIFSIGNVVSHIPHDQFPVFIDRIWALLKSGGVWVFHTMNWDEILRAGDCKFPVIDRKGLRFERKYKHISADDVDFVTILTESGGGVIKQSTKLYPQTEAFIMRLHSKFEYVAIYGNYAKKEAGPDINSRVFVFRKPKTHTP